MSDSAILMASVKKLNTEVVALKKQVQTVTTERDALKRSLVALNDEVDNDPLVADNEAHYNSQIAGLEASLSAKSAELNRKVAELNSLQTANNNLLAKSREVDALNVAKANLSYELTQTKNQLAIEKDTVSRLRADVNANVHASTRVSNDLARVTRERDLFANQVREISREADILRNSRVAAPVGINASTVAVVDENNVLRNTMKRYFSKVQGLEQNLVVAKRAVRRNRVASILCVLAGSLIIGTAAVQYSKNKGWVMPWNRGAAVTVEAPATEVPAAPVAPTAAPVVSTPIKAPVATPKMY